MAPSQRALHSGGQRFESPPLHQEVRANRRDFPGSEIARHFRSLCAENRSLQSVWHVQATFLDAYRLKSLAANFRFQGCCLLCVRRAGFRMAVRGREPRHEMIAKALLDLVPQVLRHDRRMVSLVNLTLMSDPTDVNRVRQEF